MKRTSVGESGYGAGEHAFARNAAQRYIRAQRTRSKCRRRFTAPHHHTRTPRLRFLHSQFQIQRRNEGRTLAAKKSGDPAGSADALDSLSCIRNFSGRIQSCSTVVFAVKPPFGFRFMRNCERNFCFEKTEIIRSFLRIEYTGDMGCGILVTWRNLSEKQRIWSLMLRPEMNLPERSEFSSQALLLIRFQILYFSQIPERNKDPTSHISVPFYSELPNIFRYFLI